MTSKLTREWLQHQISAIEAVGITDSNTLAAFKLALAAMQSEPVAEVVSIYGDPEAFGEREIRPLIGIQQMPYGTKLYRHAQPAPVVPDGYVMVPEEPTESMVIAGFESEPDEFFSESEVWEAYQKMSGCEQAAFRARLCWRAMLAAAPQEDINALIPLVSRNGQGGDRWIPVSERMPEKGQAVLVYRPKAHEGGDSDVRVAVYGRHNFEHGFGCYWEPSHWMPLPAAPQEVGDA
ncbi:TPA: DUF551 domain-containing protein [Klebsiella pneumoniae]|nr:DUF551 domain-containing protein [Klebsiella pneumoniae]